MTKTKNPHVASHSKIEIAAAGLAGKRSIVVLDDFFPNLTTGFRVAEYNHYLRVFPELVIASTVGEFDALHERYAKSYPSIEKRVVAFSDALLARAGFCYLNFLNNAHYYVAKLEAAMVPFLFTLYPGGGFELRSEDTDRKLARVLDSPMLRGVICTQTVTTDVLRLMRCPVDVHEIYGVTVNPIYLRPPARRPRLSGAGLKICFVAHKYDRNGLSKGYPAFIEVATRLADRFPEIELSVVGNYDPGDVELSDQLKARLQFRGLLATLQLREFLLTQDMMISPNQPYTVSGSIFDGFPTATCIEASLCGVAIVCSDELALNRFYTPDEMLICAIEPSSIASAIAPLLRDPSLVAVMAARGREKSMQLFSAEAQLLSRTQILRDCAAREGFAAWMALSSEEDQQ